ncbi:MAG: hypothetical protein WAM58_06200 [Candidatus Acidiferrum sp.]
MASLKTVPTTIGELLFQDYLDVMQYPYEFEKEFPGKSKRPDYAVSRNGVFLFDVKDFDENLPLYGGSCYDPHPRIREKIDEGRKKFKQFKEFPCSLVLKNNSNAFVHLESADIMLGAMYGDSGFTYLYSSKGEIAAWPLKRAFLGRGKMVHDKQIQNTTISALITLRHVPVGMWQFRAIDRACPGLRLEETLSAAAERFPNFDVGEKQLGVIVWENATARIPLSRELFNGPYDERWGYEDGHQTIVYRGTKLAALEKGNSA